MAAVIVIAGCSGKEVKKDTSYKAQAGGKPTAIIQSDFVVNGKVLPDYRGKQTTFIQADRQRVDIKLRFDSFIARTFFKNNDTTNITRIDQRKEWATNNTDKTYTECPLGGCDVPSLAEIMGANQQQGEQTSYNPEEGDAQCPLRVVKRELTVKDTGQRRVINGFKAKQYQAVWEIVAQDKKAKKDSSKMIGDFWVTDATSSMSNGFALQRQYSQNYARALPKDHPLSRFMGKDIASVLAVFTGSNNEAWKRDVQRKFAIIQGQPISTKMEWFVDANACQDVYATSEKKTEITDLASLKGAITGFLGKKASQAAKNRFGVKEGEPIFRFISDVKKVQYIPQDTSKFNKPAYKLQNRG